MIHMILAHCNVETGELLLEPKKNAKRSNNGYPLKVQAGVKTRTNDPTLSLLTVEDRNAYIFSLHTTVVSQDGMYCLSVNAMENDLL